MSTKMSQKEYLKKYLSGGSDKKKKKKDKKSKGVSATVKIIDDDVHGGNDPEIDEELLLTGEDAPQIVGIIDASGNKEVESKWKSLSGTVKEEKPDDDLWGKKATSYTAGNSFPDTKGKFNPSPPRKTKQFPRTDDQSPPRRRRNSDQSPPRRPPQGRVRKNSDQSPPRRSDLGKSRRDSDSSPPRRQRKNSDQSPPRRRDAHKAGRDSDSSPPRRQRKNSDQSPPRRRDAPKRDSDASPPRRQRKNSDRSPPRRRDAPKARRDSDSSPPRRQRKNSDQSPPRRTRWDSNTNARNNINGSPVRIKREKSADQSPPRRRNDDNPFRANIKVEKPSPDNSPARHGSRQSSDLSPPRIKRERHSDSPPPTHKNSGKMSKTLDGKRAGLQDAKTLQAETEERRRAEEKMFNNMSSEVSGRDAEVQFRKGSYRRRRKGDKEEEDPEVQRKKAEHEEKKKELYSRWNKGLKQIEAYQAKMDDDQYESSKPLARYSNDADLDEMLKKQEREDDPMLEYIRSKKKTQQMEANIPVMPKYKGSYPENRFGIPPGYRWDGLDRSNGYEVKWFNVQSQKKALAEEAYKYSTEDM